MAAAIVRAGTARRSAGAAGASVAATALGVVPPTLAVGALVTARAAAALATASAAPATSAHDEDARVHARNGRDVGNGRGAGHVTGIFPPTGGDKTQDLAPQNEKTTTMCDFS